MTTLCQVHAICRVALEDFDELGVSSATVVSIELMSCCGVVFFSIFMKLGTAEASKMCFLALRNSLFRQRVESQLALDATKEELSAASSLLTLTCDAVMELDSKQCLTQHSPELAAMLLIDRPGASLKGRSLLEFMPPDEALRGADYLSRVIQSESEEDSRLLTHAFHSRLLDSASSKVCVEIFQVRLSGGLEHSLVGLRDITDSKPDMGEDEPLRQREQSIRSTSSFRATTTETSKMLLLDIDMEGGSLRGLVSGTHFSSTAVQVWWSTVVPRPWPLCLGDESTMSFPRRTPCSSSSVGAKGIPRL